MPGAGRCEFAKRRQAAPVALDRNNPAGAGGEQRPRQSTGAGADLNDVRVVEPSGGAGNPADQIEVEQKILAEALACKDAVPGDDLAQRRQ